MTIVRRDGEYEKRVHKWVVDGHKSNNKPLVLQDGDIILNDNDYMLTFLRRKGE